MKSILVLLCLLMFTFSSRLQSQIAINEIRASNGNIELKNIGSTTTNIGSWYLCRFPDYRQLSTLTLVCGGDLNLEAGAIATVDLNFTVFADDDELGLYINTSFADPNSIRDYVEWGSHGHTRSSVAEAAGIWADGDFVPDWSDCVSLEYDGSGDASSNWITQDVPTMPCIANNLDGCDLVPLELLYFYAHQRENGAGIVWKAIHDATTQSIALEHSIDQQEWEIMTTWVPHGPEFDTGEFYHKNISSGMHYYRLRTAYLDGTIEYSEIALVRMCYDTDTVTIWPNPATGRTEVLVQTIDPLSSLQYVLIDAHGKICVAQTGSPHFEIDLSDLQPGVYYLQIPALGIVQRVIKF